MRRLTRTLLALLTVAIALFLYMELSYIPEQEAQRERYAAEQLDPLTHHVEAVLPYRHKYMGNASNLFQLFGHLPLQDLRHTFQLYPEELTAELIYEAPATEVEQVAMQRSLIYTSVAAFALIDNLEQIRYRFPDHVYTVDRPTAEDRYGPLEPLLDPERWHSEVQAPLRDEAYAGARFHELVRSEPSR